jgi:molecular chaperone GrpE (heat shock protein)
MKKPIQLNVWPYVAIALFIVLGAALLYSWWPLYDTEMATRSRSPMEPQGIAQPSLEQSLSPAVLSTSDARTSNFIWVVLVFSLLCTLAALLTSYALLKWRRALQGGSTSIVPSVLLEDFQKLARYVVDLSNKSNEQSVKSKAVIQEIDKNLSSVQEALNIFGKALDKKDLEIERLKAGHDARVFQRFLLRFIKVHEALQIEINDARGEIMPLDTMRQLLDLFEGALEESGVERIEPIVGSKYTSAFGVADNPTLVPTDDELRDLEIVRVRRRGYMLVTSDKPVCLRPATVEVYRFNRQELH